MADTNSKQTPIPVVPRTMKIVNPDGTVTRSGQMLLEQLQTPVATTGPHWNRPDAGSVADGAIYVESDRSVIYVNEGGQWHYLAGTMWGKLNPDERPTDLGVNDAGFDFRTTDTDPVYAPREFIWSGSQWVEATPVTYGSHFDRPPADPQNPPRMIYVENDRSGVIYQQQAHEWHYLAGTMYGTISPDERPTDLGVNDAGFEFRSTDTDPLLGGHDWIWSGTAWVEVTSNRYGDHGNRLLQPVADTWNGMLWVETDRSGVIYQNQSGVWHFLAGTMWGTLSPDQRPTDLGVNDAGFTFRATDQVRAFVWSGSAWVETTPVTGQVNLTHPNVVTRVGGIAGQIVEGGITDESAANSGLLHITAAGNVGIGMLSNPIVVPLQVREGVNQVVVFGADAGNAALQATNDAISAFVPMQYHASAHNFVGGNVAIGFTGATHALELQADSAAKPSTSTWTIFSSIKVKQNIKELSGGLEIINKLRPVEAEYNGVGNTPKGQRLVSLIAEEVQQVLPGTVSSHKAKVSPGSTEEIDILDFNPHELLFHLILAVQQLSKKIGPTAP